MFRMSSMKKDSHISGKEYWRSLDQLADTPEFKEFLYREFPENASEMTNPLTRRKFLTLMGASIALAGLAGCRKPVEKIVPYVKAAEDIIPGIPKYFATTMPLGLSAYGLVVESHEGRPTKIEGNTLHPSTLGKSNVILQAAILGLYDPDRSRNFVHEGITKEWTDFVDYWRERFSAFRDNKGRGLAVLSESFASPTLFRLRTEFLRNFPEANWYAYEPVSDEQIYQGMELATGKPLQPVYHYEKAKIICALDSDFLYNESENITANKGFAAGRRVLKETDEMNRLYVVESYFSVSGGMADHRLRLPAGRVLDFALELALELKKQGLIIDFPLDDVQESGAPKKWIKVLAEDLLAHKSHSLIIAGRKQPALLHALVFAINEALSNNGQTVTYHDVTDRVWPSTSGLVELAKKLQTGEVDTLFLMGGNPVYNAPADLEFAKAIKNVQQIIHLSPYMDETSQLAHWHLPMAHFLEGWSDARSLDGTLSVIQPLIEPLFGGKNPIEVLQLLATGEEVSAYESVRFTWQNFFKKGAFEEQWRRLLHDGMLPDSAAKAINPRFNRSNVKEYLATHPLKKVNTDKDHLEIVFQPSAAVFDGRFANNGWLQEMPDPVTKLAWDNTAIISPKTAQVLRVNNGDLLNVEYLGRTLEIPAFVLPGHADETVTITLGYGRTAAGRIGDRVGFNAYRLRTSEQPYINGGAQLNKTGKKYPLANLQDHGSMEGRPLVREATLEQYREHPTFAPEMVEHPPLKSLWDEHRYDEGYQWGMTIDLNACSGCMACVIACQSENNIPIVGKEQVAKGREMHWIRLDRYFSGDPFDPEMVHQPVACQHCENAPCEQVCPVAATVHDKEGLNVMTYNRCIGTRYCSNNCPYKVRRFNFFNYTKDYPEVLKMAQNPDVTVRSRGVMEKCTYCLQRINEAKIRAKNSGRELVDGEVISACQQSCPADAIVFGNILDPQSEVTRMKAINRNYTMLSELNVKTRTTFLAKLRNPNPALVDFIDRA